MNIKTAPRKLHLILILTGTSLLALPAAFGTFALLDTSASGLSANEPIGKYLLAISVTGFVLFSGYILTAVFNRYNPVLWLLSLLYNGALSLCYLGFLGWALVGAMFSPEAIYGLLTGGAWLLPMWTIYVTLASGYYLKHSFRRNKNILP
ncbi:MAG TPA: hypothetical protein VGB00_18930 [Pyrinomonadaceae bacterium]|jgi:hypothetical protein